MPDRGADAEEAERIAKTADEDSIREFARKLRMKAASLLLKTEKSGRLAIAMTGIREARTCQALIMRTCQALII